jgi:hypothetical protein
MDSYSSSRVSFPRPRQQLVQAVSGVSFHHFLEDILEIGVGFDSVQLAGFDQGSDRRPALAAGSGACEQMVLSAQGRRTYGALNGVAIEFDPAILDKAQKIRPAAQRVPDRVRQVATISGGSKLLLEPDFHCCEHRHGFGTADRSTLIGRLPGDPLLDHIKLTDSPQRLVRDGALGGLGDGLKFSPGMASACGEQHTLSAGQALKARVTIHLQYPREPGQMLGRMLGLSTRLEQIEGRGRPAR